MAQTYDYEYENMKAAFPDGTRVQVNEPKDRLNFIGTVVGVVCRSNWPGYIIVKFEQELDEATKKYFECYGYECISVPYKRTIFRVADGANNANIHKID